MPLLSSQAVHCHRAGQRQRLPHILPISVSIQFRDVCARRMLCPYPSSTPSPQSSPSWHSLSVTPLAPGLCGARGGLGSPEKAVFSGPAGGDSPPKPLSCCCPFISPPSPAPLVYLPKSAGLKGNRQILFSRHVADSMLEVKSSFIFNHAPPVYPQM